MDANDNSYCTVLTERYRAYCALKENMAGYFHILNKEFSVFSTRGTYGKYPQESETYGDATFSLSAHTHFFPPIPFSLDKDNL